MITASETEELKCHLLQFTLAVSEAALFSRRLQGVILQLENAGILSPATFDGKIPLNIVMRRMETALHSAEGEVRETRRLLDRIRMRRDAHGEGAES